METTPSFEYLCRVCAANTKGKNSVAECVYILRTPALKEKIERHLYLPISENDGLPQVLCKTCFRQVEATASLSQIAKHTQKVFRDFILNMRPRKQPPPVAGGEPEMNTIEITSDTVRNNGLEGFHQLTYDPARKDEVVVNVSVTDPLTRETQHKMINALKKRKNSTESRFTPKSIAQRSMTSSAQAKPPVDPLAIGKKSSPPGVINFFHNRSVQMTTSHAPSKADYTLGQELPGPKVTYDGGLPGQKRKSLKTIVSHLKASNSGQVSLLKVSQKLMPPQAKPPTTTIEAPLEKSGANGEEEALPDQIIIATPKQKARQQLAEAKQLARNIATGMTGQKVSGDLPSPPPIVEDIPLGRVIKDPDLLKLILKALKWPVNKHNVEMQILHLRNSKFTEIMSDPNLLLDADLTQILGPYLAPALLAAHALQQQQKLQHTPKQPAMAAAAAPTTPSKLVPPLQTFLSSPGKQNDMQSGNVAFSATIPYKLPAETSVQLVPASPPAEEACARPNLMAPPVQRDTITATATSKPHASKKHRKSASRPRHPSIVISDSEELDAADLGGSLANFTVDLEPSVTAQFTSTTGESVNETWLSLLHRQHNALMRSKRRRRSLSQAESALGGDLGFDTDDIVLIEPQPELPTTAPPTTVASAAATAAAAAAAIICEANERRVFPQLRDPLRIPRTLIKKRKTVIQASPLKAKSLGVKVERGASPVLDTPIPPTTTAPAVTTTTPTKTATVISTTTAAVEQPKVTRSDATPPKDPLELPNVENGTDSEAPPREGETETTNSASATQSPSVLSVSTQVPSTMAVHAGSVDVDENGKSGQANPSIGAKTLRTYSKKTKAALGQQLLEAIGLTQTDANDGEKVHSAPLSTKDPVEQIRSALKRSIRQKQQEQMQRKQEETVVQDADSTTKNVVKEVLMEAKSKNKSHRSASPIDVEDQIDKVALVVQRQGTKSPQPKGADVPPEESTDGEKEKTASKEEKSRLVGSGDSKATAAAYKRGRKPLMNLKKRSFDVNAIVKARDQITAKIQRLKAEQNAYALAQQQLRETSKHDTAAAGDAEEDDTPVHSAKAAPRKRGRRRNSEKAAEAAAIEAAAAIKRRETQEPTPRYRLIAPRRVASSVELNEAPQPKNEASSSRRPTRVSKTMSKYYKGPEKSTTSRGSSTRRTRHRN